MGQLLKNNRGFALILTILIISLIVALTLQFNTSMRYNLHAAATLKDGITLKAIAESGFDYSLAVLFEDASNNDFDTLHEIWADSQLLSSISGYMFDEGRLEVKITDHSGKIAINRLVDENGKYNTKQKDLLVRFLRLEKFGLYEEEVDSIVDAIKDWIDTDDEVTGFAAENPYYQSLTNPYSCRNSSMKYLKELLLVKGVDKELFYGENDNPGVSDYLTIYGDGRININTAANPVLMALSDRIDQSMAEKMAVYRENEAHDLKNPAWYRDLPGMKDVQIDTDLLTTSSANFEIKSTGFKGMMCKRVTGMVERQKKSLQILAYKID